MFLRENLAVRADRLVALVLLLRQRGRMTATQLADELEVSQRTVLRDIDALSTAGVPVYADRGRRGGFSLLPGFRTELTGLTHDEAVALLTAGTARAERVFGLGAALGSAVRKVVDAMPDAHRARVDDATQRFLVDPDTDLLSRPTSEEHLDRGVLAETRMAVIEGRRLRLIYAAPDRPERSHTVDPVGLVTVRTNTYLLATRDGADRTYRLSRIRRAEALSEPAERPASVDLERLWAERRDRFLADDRLRVVARVEVNRRDELVATARAVTADWPERDGCRRLELVYDDIRHAQWALWQLDLAAEVIEPATLRKAMAERALTLAQRYAESTG